MKKNEVRLPHSSKTIEPAFYIPDSSIIWWLADLIQINVNICKGVSVTTVVIYDSDIDDNNLYYEYEPIIFFCGTALQTAEKRKTLDKCSIIRCMFHPEQPSTCGSSDTGRYATFPNIASNTNALLTIDRII